MVTPRLLVREARSGRAAVRISSPSAGPEPGASTRPTGRRPRGGSRRGRGAWFLARRARSPRPRRDRRRRGVAGVDEDDIEDLRPADVPCVSRL